jgi:hypothetical protein
MEFHRKKRLWLIGVAAVLAGLALLGVFVAFLAHGDLAHVRRNRYILVGIGGILVVVGIALIVQNMRPFRLRIDDAGITVLRKGREVTFPWPAIAAARIEWPLDENSGTRGHPELWLYLPPGANPGVKPERTVDGYGAYYVVHVEDLQEPWDQFEGLLRRYAGPRFAVMNQA